MTKLPEYFYTSSSNGALYDTRKPNWFKNKPLRSNYSRGHVKITSLLDLKASLRNGPYCWPGGYEIVYITNCGEILCSACVKKEFKQIAYDFLNNCDTGWHINAACYEASNPEDLDEDLKSYCSHCNKEFGELS